MEFYAGASQSGGIQVQSTGLGISGTNGENQLFIKAGGNIGIGTSSPDYQLHIAGGGDFLVEDTGNGSAHIRLRSSSGGTASSNWKLKTGSNNFFYIDNDTGSAGTAITIDNTGTVGIGSTPKTTNTFHADMFVGPSPVSYTHLTLPTKRIV